MSHLDTPKKITVKAATSSYIVLALPWVIFAFFMLYVDFARPNPGENPYDLILMALFLFFLGGLVTISLRGLRLEIKEEFFIYVNWFRKEKKFDLKKISRIETGWFEIKRKIGRNTSVNGIRIKYDGKFFIINTKPFEWKGYQEVVAALKQAADNFSN